MTEQERITTAAKEIEAVLAKYGCTMSGSWEQISDNQQIRSRQITIAAVANWTPPPAPQEPPTE